MAKRKNNSEDTNIEQAPEADEGRDTKLGLTEAFAPITDPQVGYDEGDAPIGLTQAFGPIHNEDGEVVGEAWESDSGKWEGVDWSVPETDGYVYDDDEADAADADAEGEDVDGAEPREASDVEDDAAFEADASDPEAIETIEAAGAAQVVPSTGAKGGAKHAKHVKVEKISPQMQKSKRLRRTLVIVIVVIIVLAVAIGGFAIHWIMTSQNLAVQQAGQSASKDNSISDNSGKDASTKTAKTTTVPNLPSVLGKNLEDSCAIIGRGIAPQGITQLSDESNPIKSQVTAPLTDEPADSKTGTPTMYFGFNSDGNCIQVGYSTSTSSLGFGALSFRDAVDNEHVIETTLTEAGVPVENGSATLPADKTEYSTYASDGTTLTRERCSFSGSTTVNGTPATWSAVLSYDYTTANLTGNLSDTVRIIYVYVTI